MQKHSKWLALALSMLIILSAASFALAADEPTAAFARHDSQRLNPMHPGPQLMPGMELHRRGGAPAQELTDAQQAEMEKARETIAQAEQAFLSTLVSGGVLTQAEVDAYNRALSQNKAAQAIDFGNWTVAEVNALQAALREGGDAAKTALDASVAKGALTQEQADALNMTRRGSAVDYSTWVVADAKAFKQAVMASGEQAQTAISDALAKGSITQAQADALLCQQVRALLGGKAAKGAQRDLTEAQQQCYDTALADMQKAYEGLLGMPGVPDDMQRRDAVGGKNGGRMQREDQGRQQ